jgi:hypothetical protein
VVFGIIVGRSGADLGRHLVEVQPKNGQRIAVPFWRVMRLMRLGSGGRPGTMASGGTPGESVLVDFFYAQPVGHVIEALHHALAVYLQMNADTPAPDGDDGDRIPSMTRNRINDDLPRIVQAADELLRNAVPYQQCLDDYFRDLVAAHDGDASTLWSFDNVHLEHLPASS